VVWKDCMQSCRPKKYRVWQHAQWAARSMVAHQPIAHLRHVQHVGCADQASDLVVWESGNVLAIHNLKHQVRGVGCGLKA
jgi:hypothetical protein